VANKVGISGVNKVSLSKEKIDELKNTPQSRFSSNKKRAISINLSRLSGSTSTKSLLLGPNDQ